MFAGIIEAKKPVLSVETIGQCKRVRIAIPEKWKFSLGESISVDGICSTVIARKKHSIQVEYMPQTLDKTTARAFNKGCMVNLERSLKYGDRIHGHVVMGHVDTRSKVGRIVGEGRSKRITFSLSRALAAFVVTRGSVAVNGVSLTVASKKRGAFTVAFIPHTLGVTNLGALNAGDEVNIECDAMARYGLAGIKTSARVRRDAKKKTKKRAW